MPAGATTRLSFDGPPDLKPLFVKAVVNGRFRATSLPDTVAERRGIRVDLRAVVDYARVCGFSVGATLPMPYPHVLAFPLQVALMSRRDFPFALVGLVHVENVITWTRPLVPEDVLDVRVSATGLRPHRRGRLVDLVSEVTVEGEPVWTGTSTYLARGQGDPTAESAETPDVTELARSAGGAVWRLDEGTGRRYAGVSGDVNPIHLHALTARALGFDRAIAHGMFTYAKVIAALGPRVPAAGTSHVWFRKPVKLPTTVLLKVARDARLAVVVPRTGEGEHLVIENTPAAP
ncbi:MAG: MaoC/PaaZ C-terminal domain-containing protein [Lapillicoccus sp.]